MKNFGFSRELNKEICEVDNNLRKSLNSWWGELEIFISGLEDDPLWQSIPEFVFLAYDYFGIKRDISLQMAVIFKMVYLTKYIHGTIKDDEEGQDYNQLLQFSILIGDYISGLIMSQLLRAGQGDLISSFSDLMIEINEGLIIKHKIDFDSLAATEKTSASLYKLIFLTAAKIDGISNNATLEKVSLLGSYLGMVMVLFFNNASHQVISKYITAVNELFISLNEPMEALKGNLKMAITELTDFYGDLKKVAAI